MAKQDTPAQAPDQKKSKATASPTPRRRRRWLLGVVLLGLCLYFLPTIAARLFTNKETMAWISGRLPANIEVGEASLSWQSPVLLTDVTVKSPQAEARPNVTV